nr:hypothetical protein [Lentzea tibetensis]
MEQPEQHPRGERVTDPGAVEPLPVRVAVVGADELLQRVAPRPEPEITLGPFDHDDQRLGVAPAPLPREERLQLLGQRRVLPRLPRGRRVGEQLVELLLVDEQQVGAAQDPAEPVGAQPRVQRTRRDGQDGVRVERVDHVLLQLALGGAGERREVQQPGVPQRRHREWVPAVGAQLGRVELVDAGLDVAEAPAVAVGEDLRASGGCLACRHHDDHRRVGADRLQRLDEQVAVGVSRDRARGGRPQPELGQRGHGVRAGTAGVPGGGPHRGLVVGRDLVDLEDVVHVVRGHGQHVELAPPRRGQPQVQLAGDVDVLEEHRGQLVRQPDPRGRVGLLHRDLHLAVAAGLGGRVVPHDLAVEPLGHDQREHVVARLEHRAQHGRVEQPEPEVQRLARDAVRVVVDLARVQRDPQPDPRLGRAGGVVPAQRHRQPSGELVGEPRLRHVRRDEDQRAVAPVLAAALGPGDACLGERLLQRLVHRLADHELVRVGPGRITEPLHVDHHHRPVHRFVPAHVAHLPYSHGCVHPNDAVRSPFVALAVRNVSGVA